MTDEEQMIQLTTSVAGKIAKRFPMVERDDVAQHLLVWWLSHPRKVKEILADEDKGERYLFGTLRNAALAYCHEEKSQRVGYRTEDLHFYSPAQLSELLPVYFEGHDAWLQTQTADINGGRGTSKPAEGNNFLAFMADVSVGLERIPRSTRHVLELRFAEGYDVDTLAATFDVTTDAMKKRIERSLIKLRDELGGQRPQWSEGPGSRKAVSNAAAQAATREQEDGE